MGDRAIIVDGNLCTVFESVGDEGGSSVGNGEPRPRRRDCQNVELLQHIGLAE